MSDTGPVYLRWRPSGGGAAPEMERFETLDAALDAVEARWEGGLAAASPQILDARRILLVATADLQRMMETPEEEEG